MAHDIDFGIEDLTDFELVGSGGFASVYSARDTAFNRSVAVKVLNGNDQEINRSFERERTLMGQLSGHPNVITPYRHGYTNNGSVYLVMEYMAGGSLLDRILDKGSILATQAIDLALPIADALAHSHSQGILHKDVKPANILISGTGIPKLSDFGISTIREQTATQVAFTLAHTPPETFANGFDNRDESSDFYSLASTVYTAVTSRDAFHVDGQDSQVAYMRRIEQHSVPLLGIGYLDTFFAKAMAKDPADRFGQAPEFSEALRALRQFAEAAESSIDSPTIDGVATSVAPVRVSSEQTLGDAPTPIAPPSSPNTTNPLPYQNTMAAVPTPGRLEATPHSQPFSQPIQSQQGGASQSKNRKPLLLALVGLGALVVVGVLGTMLWPSSTGDSPIVQSATVADEETYSSIREVDFRNGAYFATSSGEAITVADSIFRDTETDLTLGVVSVTYGDLDNDGSEEAAVTTITNTASVSVVGPNLFRLDGEGKVESLDIASVVAGENGDILDAWIENALFTLEFADRSDAESPVSQRKTFNIVDDRLSSVNEDVRAMVDVTGKAKTVRFLPDTSSALLLASESGQAVVNASRGQTIKVRSIGGQPMTDQILITAEESTEQLARGVGQVTTRVWERANYGIGLEVEPASEQALAAPILFVVEIVGDVVPESTTTTSRDELAGSSSTTSSVTTSGSTTSREATTTSTTAIESTTTSNATDPGGASLAGRHGLTLQYVLFETEDWGAIEFSPLGDETYTVSGRHESPDSETWVSVEGSITKISDLELRFTGTIVVTVPYANGGQPCPREGSQTFLSTQGRKYWRMQNFTSPCGSGADYVDIYFN